jgi:hypothetical protein
VTAPATTTTTTVTAAAARNTGRVRRSNRDSSDAYALWMRLDSGVWCPFRGVPARRIRARAGVTVSATTIEASMARTYARISCGRNAPASPETNSAGAIANKAMSVANTIGRRRSRAAARMIDAAGVPASVPSG